MLICEKIPDSSLLATSAARSKLNSLTISLDHFPDSTTTAAIQELWASPEFRLLANQCARLTKASSSATAAKVSEPPVRFEDSSPPNKSQILIPTHVRFDSF